MFHYVPILLLLSAVNPTGAAIDACLKPVMEAGSRERAPFQCAFDEARTSGQLDLAIEKVEATLVAHPHALWGRHTLGNLLKTKGDFGEAVEHFELSVQGFREDGHAEGQVMGLLSLALVYGAMGEVGTVEAPLAQAGQLARESGEPNLIYTSRSIEANWALSNGGDLFAAYAGLKEAEDSLFPEGPLQLQALVLDQLTYLAFTLGWEDEGRSYLDRSIAINRESGDEYELADVLFESLLRREQALEWRDRPEAQLAAIAEVEPVAAVSGNVLIQARLACMGAPLHAPGKAREGTLARCVALGEETGVYNTKIDAVLSRMQCRWPGPGTQEALDDLLALTTDGGMDAEWGPMVYFLRARYRFELGDGAGGLREAEALFDAIEQVSAEQGSQAFQARVFSGWSFAYQDIARQVLDLGSPWQALKVLEMSRAKQLQEWLGLMGGEAAEYTLAVQRWDASLRAMDRLNRQLLLTDVGAEARADLEAQRQNLEEEEALARAAMMEEARERGDLEEVGSLAPLTQDAVLEMLPANEAIVSFHLPEATVHTAHDPPIPWVMAIHQGGVFVADLPPREGLLQRAEQLTGLIKRGDGRHHRGARALFEDLLGPLLPQLPDTVERLNLLIDGPLQPFPIAALEMADGVPIGARYELVQLPSLRVWLNNRRRPPGAVASGALAMAVPNPPPWVGAGWDEPRAFPSLPGAEAEVVEIGEILPIAVERYIGEDATEEAVASFSAAGGRLLHLAAHGVVDARLPDRSAVLLSPGEGGSDGLLRPPEILSLKLPGSLVVLSACQTAQGEVLEGDGIIGLAQAFLQAGAGDVLSTLWPVEDSETRLFFGHFYRGIAKGNSASAALRLAIEEMVAAGHPPRAWAAFVLRGGHSQPIMEAGPVGEAPVGGISPSLLGVVALVFALGAGALLMRRRG